MFDARIRLKVTVMLGGLFIGAVAASASEKARDTPANRARAASPTPPATSRPVAEDGKLSREGAFTPESLFTRHYIVSIEGDRVGHAELEVLAWHHGVTLVTRFEEWWFPLPEDAPTADDVKYAVWGVQRHSESEEQPVAWWGSGRDRSRAFNYRLGGLHRLSKRGDLTRNWLGTPSNPATLASPPGLILFQAWAKRLAAERKEGEQFNWPLLNWHPMETTWIDRTIRFEGDDTVTDTDGKHHRAKRYVYWDRDETEFKVTLWVDEKGYPLAREVPFLKLKYQIASQATAGQTGAELPFAAARKRWDLTGDDWVLRDLFNKLAADPGDGKAAAARFPETLLISFGL